MPRGRARTRAAGAAAGAAEAGGAAPAQFTDLQQVERARLLRLVAELGAQLGPNFDRDINDANLDRDATKNVIRALLGFSTAGNAQAGYRGN